MRITPRPAARDSRGEQGQAAFVVVVTMLLLLVVFLAAVSRLGLAAASSAQAQAAADAAALASLDGGRAGASQLAVINGAVLVSWQAGPGPDEVTVVVSVNGITATARATDAP